MYTNTLQFQVVDMISDYDVNRDEFTNTPYHLTSVRIYDAIHRGGKIRNKDVMETLQAEDLNYMMSYYKSTDDTNVLEHFLKMCCSFCCDVACPMRTINGIRDLSQFAEERACQVFFRAKYEDVCSGSTFSANVNNTPASDGILIDSAYMACQENLRIINFTIKGIDTLKANEINDPTSSTTEVDSKFALVTQLKEMFENEYFQSACDQAEFYKTLLLSSLHSNLRVQNISTEKGYLYNSLSAGENGDPIAYHTGKIMDFMFQNNIKRYIRNAYASPEVDNSFAMPTLSLPVKEECDGLYQRMVVNYEPERLLFDSKYNEIIGLRDEYFDAQDYIIKDLPVGVDPTNIRIALRCRGTFCCTKKRPSRYNTDGMCCDLYHTEYKDENSCRFCDKKMKKWCNPLSIDISQSATNSHIFKPAMKKRTESIITRGYRKYATLTDFLDWYFSCRNSDKAQMDALTNSTLKSRVKEHFQNANLPETLELKPNDYVFMFAEGYLVCDHKLTSLPEFYSFDSPEFTTGKYKAIDTLNIHANTVFRHEEFARIRLELQESLIIPNSITDELELRCQHCGMEYSLCEQWQRELHDELLKEEVTMETLEEWYNNLSIDNDFFDELEEILQGTSIDYSFTTSNNIIDKSFILKPHSPQIYPDLEREQGVELAKKINLGVLDDIILFQYDWKNPWERLPEKLRVDDDEGRYWKDELQRIRIELLFHWGRCYFRQGEYYNTNNVQEALQVMLGTIGGTNTGKSTLLSMVKRGINPRDIGVIDCSTFEEKFGMSNLFTKRFILVNEVKTNSKTFTPALMKQMTDQSIMSIPQKNKEALIGPISAHVWFLGNEQLFSADPSGAIARRTALIHFNREVSDTNKDPLLEFKFDLNFGFFLVAAFSSYMGMLEFHAEHDYWYKKQNHNYPYFSWIWHHIRDSNEASTSKLKKALQIFQSSMHAWRFSPRNLVNAFIPPKVKIENNEAFLDQDDPETLENWFDGNQTKVALFYMPLYQLNGESCGKDCRGFIQIYASKLREMFPGSSLNSQDNNWQAGTDFYGRDFDKEGIRLIERTYLPWPPGQDKCINTDWIIGCASIEVFKDESTGMLDEAWSYLEHR